MAQKKKQTVWHKKRGKFIPSSSLKAKDGSKAETSPPTAAAKSKSERFREQLSLKIKKAAADNE